MALSRRAAIVPHAPLLILEDACSPEDGAVARVCAATREVARVLVGTPVVVSPHAVQTGVYMSTRGGLRAFGVPRPDAAYSVDEVLSARVASSWARPALRAALDHGVTVPLELLALRGPVVAVGIAEDEDDVAGAARSLARALEPLDVSVLASVNSGAAVTPRGPLTRLSNGMALEHELRATLEEDVGHLSQLAPRLATEAGSCSLGPLLVLAHLFAGSSMEVLAHEWPVGVGYPVAVGAGVP